METRQMLVERGCVSLEQSQPYLHRFRSYCRKANRIFTGKHRNRRPKIRTTGQHENSRSVAKAATSIQRPSIRSNEEPINPKKAENPIFFFKEAIFKDDCKLEDGTT
ncbi:hypothetical protein Bca4012_019965 [Brassica carinata]